MRTTSWVELASEQPSPTIDQANNRTTENPLLEEGREACGRASEVAGEQDKTE